MHTSLEEAAFSQASTLSANVSVSPRTLCLHDERNARKNCEVKLSVWFANNRWQVFFLLLIQSISFWARSIPPMIHHPSLPVSRQREWWWTVTSHVSVFGCCNSCNRATRAWWRMYSSSCFPTWKKKRKHTLNKYRSPPIVHVEGALCMLQTHATPRTLPLVSFGRSRCRYSPFRCLGVLW